MNELLLEIVVVPQPSVTNKFSNVNLSYSKKRNITYVDLQFNQF